MIDFNRLRAGMRVRRLFANGDIDEGSISSWDATNVTVAFDVQIRGGHVATRTAASTAVARADLYEVFLSPALY